MAALPEDHNPVGAASNSEEKAAVANRRIDLAKLLPYLNEMTCTMVGMRRLGHDWHEIGEKLGFAPSTARNGFWQDIHEALSKVRRNNGPKGQTKRSGGK